MCNTFKSGFAAVSYDIISTHLQAILPIHFQLSLVCVLQVFVQFLSVFQWCSKCEGKWCACLVSWVHLQEDPLVIVE